MKTSTSASTIKNISQINRQQVGTQVFLKIKLPLFLVQIQSPALALRCESRLFCCAVSLSCFLFFVFFFYYYLLKKVAKTGSCIAVRVVSTFVQCFFFLLSTFKKGGAKEVYAVRVVVRSCCLCFFIITALRSSEEDLRAGVYRCTSRTYLVVRAVPCSRGLSYSSGAGQAFVPQACPLPLSQLLGP